MPRWLRHSRRFRWHHALHHRKCLHLSWINSGLFLSLNHSEKDSRLKLGKYGGGHESLSEGKKVEIKKAKKRVQVFNFKG